MITKCTKAKNTPVASCVSSCLLVSQTASVLILTSPPLPALPCCSVQQIDGTDRSQLGAPMALLAN